MLVKAKTPKLALAIVKTQKTYKFKLRLNKTQEKRISEWIHTCRAVYNLALETKKYAYQTQGVTIGKFELMKQLTPCRHDFDWMKDVPVHTLQEAIERMDIAYQNYFRKLKNGELAQDRIAYIKIRESKGLPLDFKKLSNFGKPRYKGRHYYKSLVFKSVKIDTNNRVILPKIGSVKYFSSRLIKGKPKRATIIFENNSFYISILTELERETMPKSYHDSQVGIDMGVAFFSSLSTGKQINNPRTTLKYEKQLRVENRSLARKVEKSNNWKKQKAKVGRLHSKIKRVREDFLHKESLKLVKEFNLIAAEDLKVKNMVRNKQLSKHILDVSWGKFFQFLEYKSEWHGNTFEKVNPMYTSQTCSCCGTIDAASRISQSRFVCTSCGHEDNADINGAKIILDRALSNLREREALACA